MNWVTRLKLFAQSIFREYAPGQGREADWETATRWSGNPDPVEAQYTATRYAELAVTPYIFAGLRARDISRLWIAASGLQPDEHGAYAMPQVIYPPTIQDGDQAVLEFVRWNLDERLQRGMKAVISQIQQAYLTYGRAVQEIMWAREDRGVYFGKIVIDDIVDRDPERFVINPKDEPAGVYLRKNLYSSQMERMPDHKFFIITNHPLFENPYGISELRPLNDLYTNLSKVMDFWRRGLEKAGKGQIIGKYGRELSGVANSERRADFLEQLRRMANDTITIMPDSCSLETLKAELEAAGFESYAQMQIAAISLVLTGSATALQEGQFGSYSKEESTSVRTKSALEQADAQLISDALTYQPLTWLVDYNYADVSGYPFVQIIEPDLILPTTPEGQQASAESEISAETETDADAPSADDAAPVVTEMAEAGVRVDRRPAPEIFNEAEVIRGAREFLSAMPVYRKDEFDKLPEAQKRESFTISAAGNQRNVQPVLERLRDALAETIHLTNEAEAWDDYERKARQIFKQTGMEILSSELFVSFRFARQAAYLRGIMQYAQNNAAGLHGLIYHTKDDPQVRMSHRPYNNIIRPVDDPYWEQVQPPLGFNCRCWLDVITTAQYEADPAKYAYTPDNKLPEPLQNGFENGV